MLAKDLPQSRGAAERRGYRQYVDMTGPCTRCGTGYPIRYTSNNDCKRCVVDDEMKRLTADKSVCWSKFDAIRKDADGYYRPSNACYNGPHLRLTCVKTSRCLECRKFKASLEDAKRSGKTRYKPIDPCPICRSHSQRLVADDSCINCKRPFILPAQLLKKIKLIAPLGLSRSQAGKLGYTHFTPAAPCQRGHTSPRFISSGGCVQCTAELNKARGRK